MHHIARVIMILATLTALRAEESAITAFRILIRLDNGNAGFRLTDHTLVFSEGDRAEETTILTDDELRHTMLLLSSNPMMDKTYAVKPVGKDIAFEVHVTRTGGVDGARYLTVVDVKKLEADMEAQAKANENDQKALEKLDEQGDFFAYVFGLAMKGKGRK